MRLNGVYWGLTALHLLGHPEALPRDATIDFVLSCQQESGGFGAAPGHDVHMLYTVSAVQILGTVDALEELDRRGKAGIEKVGKCRYGGHVDKEFKLRMESDIADLQNQETGSFAGDQWGATDTRFLYGALNALSLLDMMYLVDVPKAVTYIQACANFDGGYGVMPGAESHAGQTFTCVGALAIAGRLDLVDRDRLGGWLSERQLPNGGLNGRPEKLEDVCYSWWVLSSLAMIDRLHWINRDKLAQFILRCQVSTFGLIDLEFLSLTCNKDPERGGIADRPGDMVDVFHTVFGLAGLSLIGFQGLVEVDPI